MLSFPRLARFLALLLMAAVLITPNAMAKDKFKVAWSIYVGWMPPEAGAERLRGGHLRPALGCKLSSQLLAAITISKLKRNNQTMKALTRDPVQTFDVGKFPVDGLSKRLQSGHKDILVEVQK